MAGNNIAAALRGRNRLRQPVQEFATQAVHINVAEGDILGGVTIVPRVVCEYIAWELSIGRLVFKLATTPEIK